MIAALAAARCRFLSFLLTIMSPSLGIKPNVSLLLDDEKVDCRARGQGRLLKGLADQLVVDFLSTFMDVGSLSSLCVTSRFWYAMTHHDPIWRDLCIRHFGNGGITAFKKTWRGTFKFLFSGNCSPEKIILVDNFYSDYLFASIRCALADIPEMKSDSIPRFHASSEDFHKVHAKPGLPCILTGAIDGWSCVGKWTLDYMMVEWGNVNFRAEAVDIPITAYREYSLACSADDTAAVDGCRFTVGDESPLYIFDKDFFKKVPKAHQEFTVPDCFSSDLFSVLGEDRPDYRWLIAGPKRSGSTIHVDPNSTSAWNAVVSGSKRWILYPPAWKPPGIFTDKAASEITSPVSLSEWYLNFYHQVTKDIEYAKERDIVGPMEGICCTGEVMFIPAGWWHCVLNVEDSVAITQNFVDESNLSLVLSFLRDKPDQVSGYIEGRDLYADFVDALGRKRCDVVLPLIPLKRKAPPLWDKLNGSEKKSTFRFL
ncbi:MAG: hypothetical protein SGCHY_000710 [Lobulomycetales sp.]